MEDSQLSALAQISKSCFAENIALHAKFRTIRNDLIMALFSTFDEDGDKAELIALHCKFALKKLENLRQESKF